MRIAPFSLALEPPLSTGSGTIDRRQGFLVILKDPPGVGEATPLAGWTESLSECQTALQSAADLRDGGNVLEALESLDPATTPAARHGLGLAIADGRARRAGEPLSHWLGPDPGEGVPVYATIGDNGVDTTVASARSAFEDGFKALKLKLGNRPLEADIKRVRSVREALGPDVDIRVDANGAWSQQTAQRAIDQLGELDIAYCEQPIDSEDLSAFASLRDRGVGIALDESLQEHALADIFAASAADLLVLKPMVIGGVRRAHEMALRAREHDVSVVITTTFDGVVARMGAIQLGASLGIERACGLGTADRLVTDLKPDPSPVEDGEVKIPDRAGTGVQIG